MSYVKKIITVFAFAIVAGIIYSITTPWYIITNGHIYYYFSWFFISDYDRDGNQLASFTYASGSNIKMTFDISFAFLFVALVASVLSLISSLYQLVRKTIFISRITCVLSSFTLSMLFVAFFQFLKINSSFDQDDFLDCHGLYDAPSTFCTAFSGDYFQDAENIWSWRPQDGYWVCLALIIAEAIIVLLNIFYYYKSFIETKMEEDGFLRFFDNVKRIRRLSRRTRSNNNRPTTAPRYINRNTNSINSDTIEDLAINRSIPKFSLPKITQIDMRQTNVTIGSSRLSPNQNEQFSNSNDDNNINISSNSNINISNNNNQSNNSLGVLTINISSNNNNNNNNIFDDENDIFNSSIDSNNVDYNIFDNDDEYLSLIIPPPPKSKTQQSIIKNNNNNNNNIFNNSDNNNILESIKPYQGDSLI